MAEPSRAFYDFALVSDATLDFEALGELLERLRREHDQAALPIVELYGRVDAQDVVALLRFSHGAATSGLRRRMDTEAGRLKARLLDLQLVAHADRELFYRERLASCEVRIDATLSPREQLRWFQEQLGARRAFQLAFPDEPAFMAAWSTQIAEGALPVPSPRPPAPGATVPLLVAVPAMPPLELSAKALQVTATGFLAEPEVSLPLARRLQQWSHTRGAGRRLALADGRRGHPRHRSWIPLTGRAEGVDAGIATNLGQGGLFLESTRPPPKGSRVDWRLATGEGLTGEVVHVASGRGAGIAFEKEPPESLRALLASYQQRSPQVLLLEGDLGFRTVLAQALQAEGIGCAAEGDAASARAALAARLFEWDLVILDPSLLGDQADALLGRLGGVGVRSLVIAAQPERFERSATRALPRGVTLGQILLQVRQVVG